VPFAFGQSSEYIRTPWVTAYLLIVGMIMLLSQAAVGRGWRMPGMVGATCLCLVMTSQAISSNAHWIGMIVLLGGGALLIVEARVIPGRGICALGGVCAVFAGCYLILAATETVLYSVLLSVVTAAVAFLTLLAYISHSRSWLNASGRLLVSVGRSQTSRVSIEPPLDEACRGITENIVEVEARERRAAALAKLEEDRRRNADDTKGQQTVNDGGPKTD
jgi:membrane-bound ClpP family serine protease